MREHKYKAYHKPTNKIFPVYGFNKEFVFEDSMDGIGTSPTLPADIKDCVLLEYIQIKDKNGIEIYESDLVKLGNGSIREVKFFKYCFWFIDEKNDYKFPIHMVTEDGNDYEIVGNVFLNSEKSA